MMQEIEPRWVTLGGIRFVQVIDDEDHNNCKLCALRGPCDKDGRRLSLAERGQAGRVCTSVADDERHWLGTHYEVAV